MNWLKEEEDFDWWKIVSDRILVRKSSVDKGIKAGIFKEQMVGPHRILRTYKRGDTKGPANGV